eukprot:TRINITY_DN5467_c0_g2_i2.p1 TRINITY_DN5467_c0_g2~~TRINITY_DN5467_c0_g2_i2.p1  ORF type:complete len:509 (-),score=54.57 TRINITY_DN5467_c0_g2_i2:27-1553(-)
MMAILGTWSSNQFITRSPDEEHRCICKIVYYCLDYVEKDDLMGSESSVLSKLISGVHAHLECPIPLRRNRGQAIGNKFSKIIDPNKPLVFETEESDLESKEQSLQDSGTTSTPSSTVEQNDRPMEPKEILNNITEKKKKKDKDKPPASTSFEVNPDKPYVLEESDSDEGDDLEEKDDKEEDGEDDEDDELKPYDITDDLSDFRSVKKPIYIREAITLISSDEPDEIEVGLECLPSIIERTHDLNELSIQLCSILLRLEDQYNLTNFAKNRHDSLVKLSKLSTRHVVPYMISSLYNTSLSLMQQLDILDVLVTTAKELSNNTKNQHPMTQNQVTHQPQDNKTRRWKTITHTEVQSHVNEFSRSSHFFFSPLLNRLHTTLCYGKLSVGYDSGFTLFGQDGFLLGKSIYAIVEFSKCGSLTTDLSKYAQDMLDIIFFVRYHQQNHVREGCLLMLEILLSESQYLFSDDEGLLEIVDWLIEVRDKDVSEPCRLLATICLTKINKLIHNKDLL